MEACAAIGSGSWRSRAALILKAEKAGVEIVPIRHDPDEAVDELIDMLEGLIGRAEKEGLKLAPFLGIACPGAIDADGGIAKGAQNLPGNWESSRFNLPARLHEALPRIDGHDVAILMHNDAVVHGLSEVPFMRDVKRWGVLTIGTGLGNARFTNREGKE